MSPPWNIVESSDITSRDKGKNERNETEQNNLENNEKEILENPIQKDMLVPNTLSVSSNVESNPQEVNVAQTSVSSSVPTVSSSDIDKDQCEFPIENKSNDMPSLIPPTLSSSQDESLLDGNNQDSLEKVCSQSEPIETETVQENGEPLQDEIHELETRFCRNSIVVGVQETNEVNADVEKVTSATTVNATVSNECHEKENCTQTHGIDNEKDMVEKNFELHKEVEVENNNSEEENAIETKSADFAETMSSEFGKEMNVPSSSQKESNDLLNSIGILITQDSETFEPQRDEGRNDFEMHHDDDLLRGLPLLSKPETQDSMSESSSFKAAGLDGSDDDSLDESGQGNNSSSNNSSASSTHTNPDDDEDGGECDITSPQEQNISDSASDSTESAGGVLEKSNSQQNYQQSHDASVSSPDLECMNVFDDTDENRQLLQDAIYRMVEKNVPIFNVNTFRFHNKDLTSHYSKESLSAFLQCQLERMDNRSQEGRDQEGRDQMSDVNIVTPPRSRSKAIDIFQESESRQQVLFNAVHDLNSKGKEVCYENLRRSYRELTTRYSKSSLEEFLEQYNQQTHEELDLIGTKVAKYFGNKLYEGKVIAYNGEYWRVRYEDEDEEDYDRKVR